MNIKTVGLIYFSPTQTTRKIIKGISQGLQTANVQDIDLTPSDAETQIIHEFNNDLAIIGSPVYAGRLPPAMVSRLKRIKGNGTPAVIVAVYGNRAYEDALIELRDVVLEAGFKPIAAGAFIGEHSYSTSTLPIATGRPDADDIGKAKVFGEQLCEMLTKLSANEQFNLLQVPGNVLYKELRILPDIVPAINEALCTRCMKCITACPTAAIHTNNPVLTDKTLCIKCAACIKICPVNAKEMDDPFIKLIAQQLNMNCSVRKEPETFFQRANN